MTYSVLMLKGPTGYNAIVPDLPGVYAAGKTFDETRNLITGAISFHIRGMIADGDAVPEPSDGMELIQVATSS